MKVLGIDTTRKSAVIYVYDSESDKRYSLKMNENVKHSEGLFLYIEKALFDCKLKISDFNTFCGVVGPGSFTGIRVGMSVLKGFNIVENKKLCPMTTFEILATKYKKGLIVLNSTSTTCYYAKIKGHKVIEDGSVLKTEIVNLANDEPIIMLSEEQNAIVLEYNNIEVEKDMESLFFDCLKAKLDESEWGEFLPYYLQLSQAERNKASE